MSLRSGIASLLGAPLPPEWLDGKHEMEVWGAARFGTDLNLRAGPDSATGKEIARIRSRKNLPHRPSIGPDPSGPPLYELIAYQFSRDLEAKGVPEESVPELVRMLSLSMWRRWFAPRATKELIDLEEMDKFAEVMSEAVRIALRPWLDGDSLITDGRLLQIRRAVEGVRRQTAAAERIQSSELQGEYTGRQRLPGKPTTSNPRPAEGPAFRLGPRILGDDASRTRRKATGHPRERVR